MTRFVYFCITRLCREYHREFRSALSPTEMRHTCASCGNPVRLVRTERPEEVAA